MSSSVSLRKRWTFAFFRLKRTFAPPTCSASSVETMARIVPLKDAGCSATVDGTEIPMKEDAFDFASDGHFINAEFLAEALKGEAIWDQEENTLIFRIQKYLFEKGEYDPEKENSFTPALVNRIDRNTSGLVIAAKNAAALRILNAKMKSREIHKKYLCLVCGTPVPAEATLEGFLEKNEQQNRVYIESRRSENGKTIRTHYKVLATVNQFSLVEVDLLTGRTHQIRAHMASIGHPLLGDGKYGTNRINRSAGYLRQALCSYKLSFAFTSDAEELNYLNGRSFEVGHVPFLDDFYAGRIK